MSQKGESESFHRLHQAGQIVRFHDVCDKAIKQLVGGAVGRKLVQASECPQTSEANDNLYRISLRQRDFQAP